MTYTPVGGRPSKKLTNTKRFLFSRNISFVINSVIFHHLSLSLSVENRGRENQDEFKRLFRGIWQWNWRIFQISMKNMKQVDIHSADLLLYKKVPVSFKTRNFGHSLQLLICHTLCFLFKPILSYLNSF